MSTPYPVLANKPIDQWRVTELKEELKKRKLATKGLKDDLIRRLDEALRDEMDSNGGEEAIQNDKESNSDEEAIQDEKESNRDKDAIQDEKENDKNEEAIQDEKESNRDEEAIQDEKESNRDEEALQDEKSVNEEVVNGFDGNLESQAACTDETERSTKTEMVEDIRVDGENQVQVENATNVGIDGSPDDLKSKSSPKEVVEDIKVDGENQIQAVDKNATKVDTDDSFSNLGSGKVQDGESMVASDSEGLVGQTAEHAVSVETTTTTTISETVIVQISSSAQDSENKAVVEIEDPKLPQEDAVLNVSNPKNQVSEVSPVLGFQVNSESISTDSVSINEKNELKDNLNADNSILELEVVKPEMVQPSSSDVPFEGDDVHPMDEPVPHVNQSSMGEMYDISATNADLSRKNYTAEVGSSEKLNLDRSSGDDSMEEDILESRTMESKLNNDETGEKIEASIVKEKSPVDIMEVDLSSGKNDNHEKSVPLPVDKRKHEEQEVAVNNEPLKRQRRWNSETVKIPEPKPSNITTSTTPKDTTPKDTFRSTIPKRNFARSDSTLSGSTTPKERVVPPSVRPPTNSLRINNFLRPFTLKAVQELLAKTGTVNSFWMDHIKTHCYVMYSSVEEAVETRNALYNLQWPVNGGKLLAAEFVDPQEVKQAEAPPPPPTAAPVNTAPNKLPGPPPFQPSPRQQDPKPSPRVLQDPKPSTRQQDPKPSPRQQDLRQQLPPPPPLPLPPPPPLSDPPAVRERLQLPPPPPLPKKPDPPIVTLDDLFRKTKATPRIYYLPLSEEQVAAKLSARGKNIKK